MKPLIGIRDHVLRGSKNRYAKLDEERVLQIKLLLREGKKAKELAPMFGVCVKTINYIRAGYAWAHVRIPE